MVTSACALCPFLCCTKHKMDITTQLLELCCPKNIYGMASFEFTKQSLKFKRSGGPKSKIDTTSLLEASNCETDLTMDFLGKFYPKKIYGMICLRQKCPNHLNQI